MRRRTRLAACLLIGPVLLSGCALRPRQRDGATDRHRNARAAAATPTPSTPAPTPGQVVDGPAFVDDIERGMSSITTYTARADATSAEGSEVFDGAVDRSNAAHPRAKATMTIRFDSTPGALAVDLVLADDVLYVRAAQFGSSQPWRRRPPSDLFGSADLYSELLDPSRTLRTSRAAISRVVYVGPQGAGPTACRRHTVTLDPARRPTAPTPSPLPSTFDLCVDDAGRIRTIDVSHLPGGSRFTGTIGGFGEPVSVTAPPPSEVAESTPGPATPTTDSPLTELVSAPRNRRVRRAAAPTA